MRIVHFAVAAIALLLFAEQAHSQTHVSPDNFNRAESDFYFKKKVDDGMFGKIVHVREPASIVLAALKPLGVEPGKKSGTGPVGQPASQAIYLQIDTTDGAPMNAQYDYVIHMTKDQLPPARAFWSFTLYDGERFLFIPNPANKCSVGENAGIKLDASGGITISISAEKPAAIPAEDWLPTNRKDQPLNLRLRLVVPPGVKLLHKPYSFGRLVRTMRTMQGLSPLPLFQGANNKSV